MRLRPLGPTGLSVSTLCLGTMQFGWTANESESHAVLDAFVEAGGNFIDSADIYSRWARGNAGGISEEIIGRWLKQRGDRDSMVIATKVRGQMWDGHDGEGLSRSHITRAVEDSLRRLQVETIDLYQCHWPDENTPMEETLAVFGDLIAAGKIRYIGASNYSASQLAQALRAAETNSLTRFATLQPHYNLVHRAEYEGELASLCEREGLGVVPYSPLAGGFLTGKYRRGQPPPKSQRAANARLYMNPPGFDVIETLDTVAGEHNTTLSAVAVAWLLTRPAMTVPIIGANTPEQLAAILPAADLQLAPAEIAALDRISAGF
ncbi:MAG TPA: aldo/keto reductase [Dehalococcoidia bacterium]|nr:aldo/keto reductase [Dehalococcoidia bacterium]